uniref:Uncharacterized protein n=1 Tax=Glossina palpalis gambiensis TaxID=67801 RepID=A0A1B0B3U5_9MUSC
MPPKEVLCGSLPPDNSVEFSFLKIDGMNLDSVARFISIEFFRKFGRFALIESLTTFCTFGIKFELSEDSLVTDGPWTNEVIASGRTFLINAGAATIDVLGKLEESGSVNGLSASNDFLPFAFIWAWTAGLRSTRPNNIQPSRKLTIH